MWLLSALAFAGPWPEISPPPASGAGANDAAVVVGVSNYLLVDDVPGARDNAEDWYRWLTTTRGISPGRVHLLRDTEATKEKIERFAGEASAAAGEGGTVWFVFVGHGAPTPDGQDGVLVGADAQSDPDSLYARSVRRSSLLETLADGAHDRSIVVLDTCFSGTAARGSLMTGLQPAIPSYAFAPTTRTTVLTAGTAKQFAGPLPEAGRPAFSYLVLGAMTGWGDADGDGQVTAAEAVAYASDTIAATVKGRQQTPELTGDDLVLASGAAAEGPDVAAIVLGSGPPRAPVVDTARIAALREAQEAERVAAEREQQRLAEVEQATREQLQDQAAAAQAEAASAWEALGSTPTDDAVLAYVAEWGDVVVEVADQQQRVSVPQIELARAALERTSTPRRVVRPDPWTPLPDALGIIRLWRPLAKGWRDSLAADPEQIWTPWRMVHQMPEVMSDQLCGGCGEGTPDRAVFDSYVVDASAFAEAWLTSVDPKERRGLESALIGLVLEAQDVARYRGLLLYHDLPPGFDPSDSWSIHDGSTDDEWGQSHLLYWAFEEVRQRADDAPACEAVSRKLEALSAQALQLCDEGAADQEDAFEKLYQKGRRLAAKTHRCADDEGRAAVLEDQLHPTWPR